MLRARSRTSEPSTMTLSLASEKMFLLGRLPASALGTFLRLGKRLSPVKRCSSDTEPNCKTRRTKLAPGTKTGKSSTRRSERLPSRCPLTPLKAQKRRQRHQTLFHRPPLKTLLCSRQCRSLAQCKTRSSRKLRATQEKQMSRSRKTSLPLLLSSRKKWITPRLSASHCPRQNLEQLT